MTTKEEQTINNLLKLVSELKNENAKFREDINLQIETINLKTEKKIHPVHMERDILKAAQSAIFESIEKALTGFNGVMHKLVASVVDENSAELRKIISDSFTSVIKKDEFKQSIVSAFSHKVARTIISNNDGLFDKVSNELKNDAVFRAKMSLAVSGVIEECIQEAK